MASEKETAARAAINAANDALNDARDAREIARAYRARAHAWDQLGTALPSDRHIALALVVAARADEARGVEYERRAQES